MMFHTITRNMIGPWNGRFNTQKRKAHLISGIFLLLLYGGENGENERQRWG